ncbi:MAG: cell division protein FtsQ/DivIB, partial [Acidimicrobiales bacterium]
ALHSSVLAARHVRVLGTTHASAAEVAAAAGLRGHPPLVDVSPGAVAQRIERLPWVATASVRRSWPDTVVVRVSERRPAGAVSLPGGRWAVVDVTGRVLRDSASRPASLPALSGLASVPAAGSWLAPTGRWAVQVAAAIPVAVASRVLGVQAVAGGQVDVSLTGGTTALIGGRGELHAKMVALATMVERASLQGVKTLDLRVPEAPTLTGP